MVENMNCCKLPTSSQMSKFHRCRHPLGGNLGNVYLRTTWLEQIIKLYQIDISEIESEERRRYFQSLLAQSLGQNRILIELFSVVPAAVAAHLLLTIYFVSQL